MKRSLVGNDMKDCIIKIPFQFISIFLLICQALTVHDNLAMKICSEILTCPHSPEVRVYTKTLSSLELSNDLAKDLLVVLNEIQEVSSF